MILGNFVKGAFNVIGTLVLTGHLYPQSAVVEPNTKATYVVVGAGTAGCIIADRLAEDPSATVILIEKGGDPPAEASLASAFAALPRTDADYSYKTINDNRIAQHTKNKAVELTAGKMLGGSSSLNHLSHTRGRPKDLNDWAEIIKDDSWRFDNIKPYMQKPENLLIKDILATENGTYGTSGPVSLTRKHEVDTDKYLDAFEEIGHKRTIDSFGLNELGYGQPILYISEDGNRQSTAETYLKRIKDKPNVKLLKNTEVIKVLFDKHKNAKGVLAKNETGEFEIYATKKVVLSAGTLNTPKILMLSGVGPKKHLKKLGIRVVSDLPVGKNLRDFATVIVVHQMEASDAKIEARDPHDYPVPMFMGSASKNAEDPSSEYPDYYTTNLLFPHDSEIIPMLSTQCFNYDDEIGQTWNAATKGHEVLLTGVSLINPRSKGTIELKSSNPADEPLIDLKLLSDEQDLKNMVECLQDFSKIENSTFFKSVDAKFVNQDVGCGSYDNSSEFWECYTIAFGTSFWQYSGTCEQGLVVDSNSNVIGVKGLTVVDASIIPKGISGFLMASVMAAAEKTADIIKSGN